MLNKTELLTMKPLTATASMLRSAASAAVKYDSYDTLHKNPKFQVSSVYRGRYENGILQISIFRTSDMRLGARTPKYTVFMDVAEKTFLTWDHISQKWREAMIDNLYDIWPYGTEQDDSAIVPIVRRYLHTENDGTAGIREWQRSIREAQLTAKHKRETDPWDERMEEVGAEPSDFRRWIEKQAIPENYIFYQYSKNVKTGWCSHCERDVPISKPRHNSDGKCPHCQHTIKYKAVGKCGQFSTDEVWAYLIQRYEDGFILREYWAYKHYKKGKYKTPEIHCREIRRVIFDTDLSYEAFYFGDYKHKAFRWIKDECLRYYNRNTNGKVYKQNISGLNALKKTGLREFVMQTATCDPELYMAKRKDKPYLEQLTKAGLCNLALDYVENMSRYYSYYEESAEPIPAKSLAKSLRIDKARLNRLQKQNGGYAYLRWLVHEKAAGKCIDDDVIAWMVSKRVAPKDVQFISDRMTERQIMNYLERQMLLSGKKIADLLTTWEDYLHMALRAKMDVHDAIVYRTKDLCRRHDELVEYLGSKDKAIRAGEITEKFPDIDSILSDIREKYSFEDDTYSVLVPSCIEDILTEGETLHHCIDKADRYFERIQQNESYLLFLRKKEDVDKPWYTLEVEPGGTIRQKRTEYNRQNDDLQDAQKFLEKWQQEISKRMSDTDKSLASTSKALRMKEFAELREQGVKIQNGYMAGFLLADVLQNDLMESGCIA